MIDTAIQSSDFEIITAFCAAHKNVLGPETGRAAVEEFASEEGEVIPAQDAIGDPETYYACIRSSDELTLPEGVELCEEEIARALLGWWA